MPEQWKYKKGGDMTTAKRYLAKANPKAAETQNNLGIIAMIDGDLDTAEKYFNAAKAAGLIKQADANLKELKKETKLPLRINKNNNTNSICSPYDL